MKKIKTFRGLKGLSQQELADILGVRQSTVAMWETGTNTPRAGMFPKMAKIFGCTIDDLYDKEPTRGQAS